MNFPKYHQTNSQERLGVNAVAEAIAKIGQIWRETPMADVGIDGQIEYVSPEGFATGRMIAVQIKSGPSFFRKAKEIGFSTQKRSTDFTGKDFRCLYS